MRSRIRGVVDALPVTTGWHLLAGAVVAVYLVSLAVSAATAPPLTTTPPAAAPAPHATVDGSPNGTPGNGTVTPPSNATPLLETDATLVGAQGPFRKQAGRALVVRRNGRVAWEAPDTPWAFFDVDSLSGNRVLASFVVKGASRCGDYEPPCARTGFRIYDVTTGELLREWSYPVRRHINRESHDADLLPNGNVVVAGMDRERIFTVNENGSIVWEWRASNFYEAPADPTRRDWLHINDVDYLGDGRFLVSVRNANQLLIVEVGKGVVEVINEDTDDGNDASCRADGQLVGGEDGDVRCGDPEVFDHQHNPQLVSPTQILVADSDNDRVVLVEERGGDWTVTWSLASAGGIDFRWPRDVDLLPNGNLLITDSLNGRVVEVTWNGSVVWSVSPAKVPYEADRLPGGEYPPSGGASGTGTPGGTAGNGTVAGGGLPTVTAADPGSGGDGHVPVLTALYRGANGTFSLPYWYTQWHFLGLLLTVATALGSLVVGAVRG